LTGRLKVDVVTYESVTVPAGSFMAFKIIGSLEGRRFFEQWYAPEARAFIRGILYDQRGRTTQEYVLVDYQKSDEPAEALKSQLESTPK